MKTALITLLIGLAIRGLYDVLLFAIPFKDFWTRFLSREVYSPRLAKSQLKLLQLEAFEPQEESAKALRALILLVAVTVFCGSLKLILLGLHMGLMNHDLPFEATWANGLHDCALLFLPIVGIWSSFSLIAKYRRMRWLVPSLRSEQKISLQNDIRMLEAKQDPASANGEYRTDTSGWGVWAPPFTALGLAAAPPVGARENENSSRSTTPAMAKVKWDSGRPAGGYACPDCPKRLRQTSNEQRSISLISLQFLDRRPPHVVAFVGTGAILEPWQRAGIVHSSRAR